MKQQTIFKLLMPASLAAVLLIGCTKKNDELNTSSTPVVAAKKTNDQILKEAQEDFEDIVAGKLPAHSIRDPNRPDLADGGTIFYTSDNYKVTIQKRMTDENGVHGFLYGPIIVFNDIYEDGKPKELKSIKFYKGEELEKMLTHSEKR